MEWLTPDTVALPFHFRCHLPRVILSRRHRILGVGRASSAELMVVTICVQNLETLTDAIMELVLQNGGNMYEVSYEDVESLRSMYDRARLLVFV